MSGHEQVPLSSDSDCNDVAHVVQRMIPMGTGPMMPMMTSPTIPVQIQIQILMECQTLANGCSGTYVVAHTSFEDPFTISSVKYTDTGDESVDRYLWNNMNQPHVSHNQSSGSEMGFSIRGEWRSWSD